MQKTVDFIGPFTLPWRHSECDGVSNHRRLDCLLNRLFLGVDQKDIQKSASLAFVGTGEFPAQRASNAEKPFIWSRNHTINRGLGAVSISHKRSLLETSQSSRDIWLLLAYQCYRNPPTKMWKWPEHFNSRSHGVRFNDTASYRIFERVPGYYHTKIRKLTNPFFIPGQYLNYRRNVCPQTQAILEDKYKAGSF